MEDKYRAVLKEKMKKDTEYSLGQPSYFVSKLRDNLMSGNVLLISRRLISEREWKDLKYNISNSEFQEEFLTQLSGMHYFFHRLNQLVLNLRYFLWLRWDNIHSRSPVVAVMPEEKDAVASILICLHRIVSFVPAFSPSFPLIP